MTTVATIDLLQGRISVMQQRLEHYLGDGPAGSGLRIRRSAPHGHGSVARACPWAPPTIPAGTAAPAVDAAAATAALQAVLTAPRGQS
jgi:hypothetical protein